jgi:signal peptidase I
MMRKLGKMLYGLLTEIVDTVLPALVIAVLINFFVAQGTFVYGQSMEPSLHTDQRLIVEKISYRVRGPRRGDIVVVRVEGHEVPPIKRVIGLPGERIEIREGRVWIDGHPLEEAYLAEIEQRDYGPFTVPAEHIFVMGDNRNLSGDSRIFGPVHLSDVWGRAWLSYWPPKDFGFLRADGTFGLLP